MGAPKKEYPQSRWLHTSLSHAFYSTPILETRTLRLTCPSTGSWSGTGSNCGLVFPLSIRPCHSQKYPMCGVFMPKDGLARLQVLCGIVLKASVSSMGHKSPKVDGAGEDRADCRTKSPTLGGGVLKGTGVGPRLNHFKNNGVWGCSWDHKGPFLGTNNAHSLEHLVIIYFPLLAK